MTLGVSRIAAAAAVWLLVVHGASAQTAPADRPQLSDEVFRNIQVLKGLPVNQFMATMGFFSASLGVSCTYCHVAESGGSWEKYADDIPAKQTARTMVRMMTAINRGNFAGRQVVTCYTCHRGGNRPKVTPSLAALYGASPSDEPSDIIAQAPGGPAADQILDKYMQALGGAQRVAAITSFTARGTAQRYEDPDKHPVEVYAKAPGQRAVIIHGSDGDASTVFDGRSGWIAAPNTERPVTVVALAGGDLDGVKLDAELSFPARIKQALGTWRVGLPATIDDRDVQVLQGTSAGGTLATLYFAADSGLLVRLVRYADSPVGRIPTQIDFADYRDVAGVRMPFHWTLTWLDGRDTIELTEIQANVAIDAAKFGRPAAPKPR
jgi:outer membrane lipoprotein-sorting protein